MNRAFTSRDRQRQAGQVPSVLMVQALKGVGMAVGLESVVGSRLPAAPARGATAHGALAAVALVWPGQRSSAAGPGHGDRVAWPPGPHWQPSGSRLGGRLLGRRLPPGSSGRDSRPARCSTGGPRARAQHQALAPEQAAALRRRRERPTLAATLARSSVTCVVWAGVVSMTPPGPVATAPPLLAVVPLDRHSPARRYARTAPGPACYSGAATFNSSHHAKLLSQLITDRRRRSNAL